MVVELAIGAVGLISVVYPGIKTLHSSIWKVIDELVKANRDAKDPKVFRQLEEELEMWDELLRSIDRVKRSDDPDDRVLSAATSLCGEYKDALVKTLEYLEQFQDTDDKKEMGIIIDELRHQFKSVRRHRRKVQKWIGDINTIIVSRIHEELNRQNKTNSEAFKAQSQTLENIHESQATCVRELLEIRHRFQELEEHLKRPQDHEADDFQMESARAVSDLAEKTDDLISVCCEWATGSVVSRTTEVSMTSDFQEFRSDVWVRGLLEGSTMESRLGSSTTVSQGTQTTLSHPSNRIAAAPVATPSIQRLPFEQAYDSDSDSETDSEIDSLSEEGTNSSNTTVHLDDAIEVQDRTQPEEDLQLYTTSNAILKKLEPAIENECKRIAAGSFGQATRGGPEVLTMNPAEWGSGVSQNFRSPRSDSIGLAFERDWKPFQSNPGLATLSNECKAHHLVRRVSFITRTITDLVTDLDFYDLRQGLARGLGGLFAWNMTENCTHDECEKNLDLLCAESLIRVGEDSSRWQSTVLCITVPWKLYRFWTTIRGHSEPEPSGVGYLVDQGLLAEMPVKIEAEDGQTWQRLWCPETVEGAKEILAMFHEVSSSPN
ncbi:uncharacterized protein NECHADRAFT_74103 [Fusarium vanettenii 77-13-4]|uniref:Fungal N-terminal domain-containing protein n=1 Tax=Fusarium vanettenii (strain ATCC MYA-4622 / CBS 123669 / FGSC 9596 / NRRL 45880 / 77-13-4) TaxID=660122 RepID=C7YVW8_FUSV7|nr:uncharacterized protein NECHADRAFT_74103 [Fusarium vanettenii 77-13-4]EEU44074.1 predicted protein [Fusarium vanettenii 77-13-4]